MPRVSGVAALSFLCLAAAMASRLEADKLPEGAEVYGSALLQVWAPPDYPAEAQKAGVGGEVTVRLIVDEKGSVVSARVLDATDARFGAVAVASSKKWVFSPALEDGRPVACSMDAPIFFSPSHPGASAKHGLLPPADQIPRPSPTTRASLKETPDIDYPDELFDRRLSGRALYSCDVLPDGRTANMRITAATHSDFVLPALKAMKSAKFTPAMQGDLPIRSDIDGEIHCEPNNKDPGDVLSANSISGPDGRPPVAHVDPVVVVDPIWPYDLLIAGKGGSASVAYTVGSDGTTKDVAVVFASDPEFGEALAAAIEAERFSSPSLDDNAAEVPLLQKVEFHAIAPGADPDSGPLARLVAAARAGAVGGPRDLDQALAPLYRAAPKYPASLRRGSRPAGRADIEFIIDREGRARLPRIISATEKEFGWSAATAVSQWVFRAPLRHGQPVDVKVRIPFEFKAPEE